MHALQDSGVHHVQQEAPLQEVWDSGVQRLQQQEIPPSRAVQQTSQVSYSDDDILIMMFHSSHSITLTHLISLNYYYFRVCLSCYDELAMQSAGVNNVSRDNRSGDSSGEEESDDDEAGDNVEEVSDTDHHLRSLVMMISARFTLGQGNSVAQVYQ